MGIQVIYNCDGCNALAAMRDVAPVGWVVRDSWTQCVYCPKCWADICAHDEPKAELANLKDKQ